MCSWVQYSLFCIFPLPVRVYGNPDKIPVTETPTNSQLNRLMGEAQTNGRADHQWVFKSEPYTNSLFAIFQPVGATFYFDWWVAHGRRPTWCPRYYANSYWQNTRNAGAWRRLPNRDGSCIRDYIHVSDIAHAHTLSIQYLLAEKGTQRCEVFNLGSGNGVTVLEAITFEKVSNVKLSTSLAPPVLVTWCVAANNGHARTALGWETKYSLDDMMATVLEMRATPEKADASFYQSRPADLN